MAESHQTTLIRVPKNLGPSQRIALATEIINFIKQRTSRGLDINNKPFKRYSKAYRNDQDFDLAGKSASRVNLQFTGEMINEIELIRHGSGFVVIGFERGSDPNDKAAWNKEKGRSFLGITEKDKQRLVKKVQNSRSDEIEEIIEVPTLTKRILDRIRGN